MTSLAWPHVRLYYELRHAVGPVRAQELCEKVDGWTSWAAAPVPNKPTVSQCGRKAATLQPTNLVRPTRLVSVPAAG